MRVPVTGLAWMMLVSTLLTVSPAEAACPPDDSCSGNGICVVNACVCDAGFTGTNCEIDVDECAPAPCQNGGACLDLVNGYTCSCVAGFTGTNCEIDVDECAPAPCQNGGACFDLVNGYTCSCPPGFTGLNCETVVSAVPSMSWRAFFLLVGLLLAVGLPGLRRHLRRAP